MGNLIGGDLTSKYAGKEFVFYSPFIVHPGFEDGDRGVIVRHDLSTYVNGDDPSDLFIARNERTGAEDTILGGEAYVPGTHKPLIEEHAFTNWTPE